MTTSKHIPLSDFHLLERTAPTVPQLNNLPGSVREILAGLGIAAGKLRGKRIAIAVGSRGIACLQEIVQTLCDWLKAQGAGVFIIPAMGSHGGGTSEGQRSLLASYGITEAALGVEIRSSMESVLLGATPEGFRAFMDRNAWESDGVVVLNRVKPHTDFTGRIESGLLKMMTIGMGKLEGATEGHRNCWKFGFETTLRALAEKVLASGKILCGVAVVENEFHQIAALRAALPEGLVKQDEAMLDLARTTLPRIPFNDFQLLIVDEIGKNISGTGMDTKVIGRGVKLEPGEAPNISMIYVRDVTDESHGNALGMGFADVIHERLYRKIDFAKTYLNVRTSLNFPAARLPVHFPSDREALDLALSHLGSPEPPEQRIVWVHNTLSMNRLAISAPLAREATQLRSWHLSKETRAAEFDPAGDLKPA
jgi:hypothetical protein